MRLVNPSLPILLAAHLLTSCPATPIPGPPTPRSQHCTNAPLTVAGSFLPRSPLLPRKSTTSVIWCAPHSATYILLTTTYTVPPAIGATISRALLTLSDGIGAYMARAGDGVLLGGALDYLAPDEGVEFHAWNTNNRQQTYGVLRAAVEALRDFMGEKGVVGANFYVYDGVGTEVGSGTIG